MRVMSVRPSSGDYTLTDTASAPETADILCSVARNLQVPLTVDEIKLIVVALRQVRHTFAVAKQQGETDTLVAEYEVFDDLFQQLHDKFVEILGPQPPEPLAESKLRRVK